MSQNAPAVPVTGADFGAPNPSPRYQAWLKRFAAAQAGAHIPDILGAATTEYAYVQRAMLLDLSATLKALEGAAPATVSLFADTLFLPANTNWTIDNSSVTIVARHIEIEENVSFTLDPSQNPAANLTIYAQSGSGTLEILTPSGAVLAFDPAAQAGVLYEAAGDDVAGAAQAALPAEWLRIDSDLGMLFTAQFQYATVLSGNDRLLAREIAAWLRRCALQSPQLFDLGAQAAALEVALNALSASTTFVPVLSKNVYLDLAKAYTDAAKKFEEEYDQLQRDRANVELWKRTGRLWLDQQFTESDFIAEQLADAESSWDGARAAVRAAANTFKGQHLLVEQTATTFRHSVNVWMEEQKLELAGKIIMGVMNVVQAIASLAAMAAAAVATGGAAAGAAGGSAVSTVATLQETIKATVEATMEAAEQGSKLAKTLEELADFIEKVSALIEAISGLVETAGEDFEEISEEADKAAGMIQQLPTVPAGLDLAGVPTWEKFRLESAVALEPAIAHDIPSARDYRLQLDILVEYGKALTANHFGLIKAGQELARLKLQQRAARQQQAHLAAYIADLQRQQAIPLRLQQLLNLRYLDTKRSLFVALQHYAWAFRYWALKPSQIKPGLDRRTRDMIADLATAQREYAAAEAGFRPQPQAFSRKVIIAEPTLLAALRRDGALTTTIGLDHPAFRSDDRVRIEEVSVWLDGVNPLNGAPVSLKITTSGSYDDRLRDQRFSFSTEPLERDFEYALPPGQAAPEISVYGIVHQEHRFAYPMPTPFTEWTVKIAEAARASLDLQHVSRVVFEFKGSRMSRPA